MRRTLSVQVKPRRTSADHGSVDFVHTCAFCDWTRTAATAVVLPAGCPHCGSAVDSYEAGTRAIALPPPAMPDSRALRVALWAFAFALLFTAARAGSSIAGLSGGIAAVGVAGFLLLPFVPERLGPRG
jgi:hypothetical protein